MRCWLLATALTVAAAAAAVAQPPVVAPPPVVAAPSRAVIISSDAVLVPPASGCSACEARGGASYVDGSSTWIQRWRSPGCEGCSTLRCEIIFFLGGCRAFYGEGRFRPPPPAIIVP